MPESESLQRRAPAADGHDGVQVDLVHPVEGEGDQAGADPGAAEEAEQVVPVEVAVDEGQPARGAREAGKEEEVAAPAADQAAPILPVS